MLETPAYAEQIAWTKDGTAFCVYDPAELATNVLPMMFKHNNFQSLVRQVSSSAVATRTPVLRGDLPIAPFPSLSWAISFSLDCSKSFQNIPPTRVY